MNASLQRTIGITRLAVVTGLDRCGVEVVSAMRPDGHVLQVSNGKGLFREQARLSAIGEAAELWAAERPEPHRWRFATVDELDGEVWSPDELGGGTGLWSRSIRCAWAKAGDVWVPAQAIWCLPPGSPSMGPAVILWTSNGLAAHPVRAKAIAHGLCEVLERDALPDSWSFELARQARVNAADDLSAALRDRGFEVGVFDLTRGPMPVAGAVLVDRERGPIPVTAGYACRPTFEAAAEAALLEAAQSRLTDIQGVREDVLSRRSHLDEAELWSQWLAETKPRRPAAPKKRPMPEHTVIDLSPGVLPGLQVVKVLVKHARVSDLLR